jgi:hypothetical protein
VIIVCLFASDSSRELQVQQGRPAFGPGTGLKVHLAGRFEIRRGVAVDLKRIIHDAPNEVQRVSRCRSRAGWSLGKGNWPSFWTETLDFSRGLFPSSLVPQKKRGGAKTAASNAKPRNCIFFGGGNMQPIFPCSSKILEARILEKSFRMMGDEGSDSTSIAWERNVLAVSGVYGEQEDFGHLDTQTDRRRDGQ